ncbi:MAG: hypothetical protein KBA31_15745 [Alphaproteobacteria bacterium]|nr:hypothetical protein [Alphaproteobacteria bacterium]
MTRPTQRQLVDAMKRAIERASQGAAERYGIKKKGKAIKPKANLPTKAIRRARVAAE